MNYDDREKVEIRAWRGQGRKIEKMGRREKGKTRQKGTMVGIIYIVPL